MQTFLPVEDLYESVKMLDKKRLGKQRVESSQLLTILLNRKLKNGKDGKDSQWRNHPACRMWRGYEECLKLYYNYCVLHWIDLGCNNTMPLEDVHLEKVVYPPWLNNDFCKSHRSNLLRKNELYYRRYGWTEPVDLPYVWPI